MAGDIKIESHNQSGGITAQNVNSVAAKTRRQCFLKRNAWWIVGGATLLGVAIQVYQFFGGANG
jgi:hypothetical protein